MKGEGEKGGGGGPEGAEKRGRSCGGPTCREPEGGRGTAGEGAESAGTLVLSISSAVIKAGRSRDVMLTTSGLYLQPAAAIIILLLNSIVYAQLRFRGRPRSVASA